MRICWAEPLQFALQICFFFDAVRFQRASAAETFGMGLRRIVTRTFKKCVIGERCGCFFHENILVSKLNVQVKYMLKDRIYIHVLYWFRSNYLSHTETSQKICTAHQLTGFYMRVALAFNGLTPRTLRPWLSATVTEHWTDQQLWGLKLEGISVRKPDFFDFLCFTFWLLFHWINLTWINDRSGYIFNPWRYILPEHTFYPNTCFTWTYILLKRYKRLTSLILLTWIL